MILIGIDPGVKTGYAVWDTVKKKFRYIGSVSPSIAILGIQEAGKDFKDVRIYVEDVYSNKAVWSKKGASPDETRKWTKVSRNVGINQGICYVIISMLTVMAYDHVLIKPGKRSITKIDAETFNKITGYTEQTDEHGRDAAMLVFGR